jgi:hypothetical protein
VVRPCAAGIVLEQHRTNTVARRGAERTFEVARGSDLEPLDIDTERWAGRIECA